MTEKYDDPELFARAVALQGLALPPARCANVAATVLRQIESERAATDKLAFEVEPATFFRILEGGAK